MQLPVRLSYFIVAAIIIASAIIGVAIPVSSGGRMPWTKRPTEIVFQATATSAPLPTATELPTTLPVPTVEAALEPTAMPTVPVVPTVAVTATAPLTVAVTATAPLTATGALTTTIVVTPTAAAVAAPTATAVPAAAADLTIIAETARLRGGPDTAYPVVGAAKTGDLFKISGRNEASTWWQVCCLPDGNQGWVSSQLATVSAAASAAPVIPVAPPPAPPAATPAPAAQ
jgi:hypothetical protein